MTAMQDTLVTQSEYGDFSLMQNTLTNEAYFSKEGDAHGLVVDADGYVHLECRQTTADSNSTITLPRLSALENVPVQQNIFMKYIDQNDVVDLHASENTIAVTEGATRIKMTLPELHAAIASGQIQDARVIAAVLQRDLQSAHFSMEDQLNVIQKYRSIQVEYW